MRTLFSLEWPWYTHAVYVAKGPIPFSNISQRTGYLRRKKAEGLWKEQQRGLREEQRKAPRPTPGKISEGLWCGGARTRSTGTVPMTVPCLRRPALRSVFFHRYSQKQLAGKHVHTSTVRNKRRKQRQRPEILKSFSPKKEQLFSALILTPTLVFWRRENFLCRCSSEYLALNQLFEIIAMPLPFG